MYKYEAILEIIRGDNKQKYHTLPYTIADFRLKEPKDLAYIKKYLKIKEKDLKEIERKIENLQDDEEFETVLAVSDFGLLVNKLSLILTVDKLRAEDPKSL